MSQPEPSAAESTGPSKRVLEVEPMEVDLSRIVAAGTGLFALTFVGLILFHDRLSRAGHGNWPWIALVGTGLGLLGLAYLRRRDRSDAG